MNILLVNTPVYWKLTYTFIKDRIKAAVDCDLLLLFLEYNMPTPYNKSLTTE